MLKIDGLTKNRSFVGLTHNYPQQGKDLEISNRVLIATLARLKL
jgi:hypothetical protein